MGRGLVHKRARRHGVAKGSVDVQGAEAFANGGAEVSRL